MEKRWQKYEMTICYSSNGKVQCVWKNKKKIKKICHQLFRQADKQTCKMLNCLRSFKYNKNGETGTHSNSSKITCLCGGELGWKITPSAIVPQRVSTRRFHLLWTRELQSANNGWDDKLEDGRESQKKCESKRHILALFVSILNVVANVEEAVVLLNIHVLKPGLGSQLLQRKT